MQSLFFWRDRTRELDFVVDVAGRLEMFETRAEVPAVSDAVNLEFVRSVVDKAKIASAAIVCRAANGFPLAEGVRAWPVTEQT